MDKKNREKYLEFALIIAIDILIWLWILKALS